MRTIRASRDAGSVTVSLMLPPRREKKLISSGGCLALETPKFCVRSHRDFSPHLHHIPHISVRARYRSGSRSTNMQCQEWPGWFVSRPQMLRGHVPALFTASRCTLTFVLELPVNEENSLQLELYDVVYNHYCELSIF